MSHPQDFYSDKSKAESVDIDLRKEVAMILEKHGTWGLLRKRVRDRKCSCFDDVTDEARSDCTKCLGTGWAFIDHPVRYRKTIVRSSRDSKDVTTKFYMKSYTKPDRGDFIAEIAQDEESRVRNFQIQPEVPLTITKMYNVQDVNDLREAGGRIEFWTIVADEYGLGDNP